MFLLSVFSRENEYERSESSCSRRAEHPAIHQPGHILHKIRQPRGKWKVDQEILVSLRVSYLRNQQFHIRNTSPHLNHFEKEQPMEEVRKARLNTEAALVHDGLLLLSEAAGSSAASRTMTAGAAGIWGHP